MILTTALYDRMRVLQWRMHLDISDFTSPQQAAETVAHKMTNASRYFKEHSGESLMDRRDMSYAVDEIGEGVFGVSIFWSPKTLEFELVGGPSEGTIGSLPRKDLLGGPIVTANTKSRDEYRRYSWNTETRRWVFKHTRQLDNGWGLHSGAFSVGDKTY